MTNQSLVSIIIPVYKVEKYLESCIESVVNQTYKKIEIILVNDGSPDNSHQICDEYAMRDDRVIVIHKENGGLSDARNAGLDIARGEYIAFVDSDDIIHPQFIEILLDAIGNSELALCKIKIFFNKDVVKFQKIDNNGIEVLNGKKMMYNLYNDFWVENVVAWNKLYKKSLWQNLRYPVGRLHEDEFVIHHLFSASDQVSIVNEKMYFYRQRQGSITAEKGLKNIVDFYEALEDRKKILIKDNLEDIYLVTNEIQKNLLLKNIVNHSTDIWKAYHFSDIIKDNLSFKTKMHLALKKIAPSLYLTYKKIKKIQE